jgi:predicted transcriptional regulator
MSSKVLEWAKDNPAMAGLGIVVIGGILLLLFKGGGGQAGNGDGAAAAYYAANAAEAQSGNALEAVRIQAQAATAQTQIGADVSTTNNTTWANTDLAINADNNATTRSVYPFMLQSKALDNQNAAISALAAATTLPGTVTTQVRHSGRVVNQDYHANPVAQGAIDQLSQFVSGTSFSPAYAGATMH